MDTIMNSKTMIRSFSDTGRLAGLVTNLAQAKINQQYSIKDIKTSDHEIKNLLFSLGCYEGEYVTVISVLADNYVISVKDARYSIDKDLAKTILI